VKFKIKTLCDKFGWFYWMPPANQYGGNGISDFHMVHANVFMVVEAKSIHTGDGKPTTLQKGFLTTIQAAGHFAFVVDEPRLEYFEAFLGAFARATLGVQKNGEKGVDPVDGSIMLNCIRELTKDYMDFKDEDGGEYTKMEQEMRKVAMANPKALQ
jgi:hypothetical protein